MPVPSDPRRHSQSQKLQQPQQRPQDDEQTIASDSASVGPDERTLGDQTMVDGTMQAAPGTSPSQSSQPVRHQRHDDDADDATLGDQTFADPSLAPNAAASGDDGTLMDAGLAGSIEPRIESDTDATLVSEVEPISKSKPYVSESFNDDATLASVADGHAAADDGTLANDVSAAADNDRTQGADAPNEPPPDATLPGPHARAAAPTDDRTLAQPDDADPDCTQIQATGMTEPDRDQTVLEGTGGIAESFDPDATQISQNDGKGATQSSQRKPPRKPGVHETADRWEATQRYSLVSNFARGGLGQIWLANDTRLRREVAYKEMLPAGLKNRAALERFLEEAQITGQLEHPGIMPIYDIGYQPNGAPFYSMKLVRGETFEKHIAAYHESPKDDPERPIKFRKLLRQFIDICNALAFAHDRGVLHRDLKPLNVMIGAFGETLVLDWGLAKVMDLASPATDDQAPVTTSTSSLGEGDATLVQTEGPVTQVSVGQSQTHGGATVGGGTRGGTMAGTRKMIFTDVRSIGSQTMMGSVMGTPAYMPPEQATGKLDELDPRSDIYSLGGILYKLLTNQQPIEKGKIQEVLDRVINNKIIPPRQHDLSIPAALAAIAMKALAKLRDDRYSNALLLAADVEAWMADEPVSCFEDPPLVKARRWVKKHRTAVTTTAAIAGVIIVGSIGSAWLKAAELSRLRNVAQVALRDAESSANQRDFKAARQTLTQAIGRVADKAELSDLKQTLESQMSLFEERRVDSLRRDAVSKLEAAETDIEHGRYDDARASLLALQTLLNEEAALKEQLGVTQQRLRFVEAAIAERAQIAHTQKTFEQFRRDVDTVRARGSLLELEDIDDDAKQALASGQVALAAFALDQAEPLKVAPQHFDAEQFWVKQHKERTGQTPLEALREDAFETLLIMAEMHVTLARNAAADEQKAAAEQALKRLAQAEAIGLKSLSLHARRSDYLKLADQAAEAAKSLAIAQAMTAESALDNFMLGESLRKQQRYQEALSFYLKAQQQDPDHYWVQHCTGLCYLQLNQSVAAASCFSTCLSLRPTFAWPHMLRGFAYAEMRDFDSAYRDFDQALVLDGKLYNVFINRGASYLKQQRFEEALKDFQKAAELKPDAAKPLINIAVVHREHARRLIEEPEAFDAAATPQQVAQRRVMREAEIGKRLDLALAALASAAEAERAPAHPAIHQLRASIFEMQTNDPLAIEAFQRHIKLEREPDRLANSHNSLGKLYSRQREFMKALDAFTAANKLQPKRADVVYQLGETHLQLGNFDAAIKSFQQFQKMVNLTIEDQITNPELLYSGIATAYDALGKKNEAIEYYTLALVFDRSQAVPLTKRGWSYVTQANRLAQKDFEEATQLNPDNADSWTGLAYVQASTGALKESLANAQRAAQLAVKQANDPAIGVKAWPLFFNVAEVYGRCHQRLKLIGAPAEADFKLAEQMGLQLLKLTLQVTAKEPDATAREKLIRAISGAMESSDDLKSLRETSAYAEAFKKQ